MVKLVFLITCKALGMDITFGDFKTDLIDMIRRKDTLALMDIESKTQNSLDVYDVILVYLKPMPKCLHLTNTNNNPESVASISKNDKKHNSPTFKVINPYISCIHQIIPQTHIQHNHLKIKSFRVESSFNPVTLYQIDPVFH